MCEHWEDHYFMKHKLGEFKYLKNQPYSIQLHIMEGILLGLCACGAAKHEQFDILMDHRYLSITNIDIKHIYILV